MSDPTMPMRELAAALIGHESRRSKSFAPGAATALPVCERLRPHLATLMGNTGFRALLARALSRAAAEVPSIRAWQVTAEGRLERVDATADPGQFDEGNLVMVAQMIELLVAFIGETLTLQLLREIWPKLVPNDLSFGYGDKP